MATTRKKTRKPVRKNAAKRKPVRKNTAKKPVRNAAKKKTALTWGMSVKGHPISGRPVAGRVMSQRDQKLFTKMGKRRAGVTLKTIKEAYGKDYEKLAKVKKKAKPAARKAAPKRKTTTRKPAARKAAPKREAAVKRKPAMPRKGKPISVSGIPEKRRPQKYVVVNVTSGNRYIYQSSHRLLTTARKKEAALSTANPRKTFAIVKLDSKAS